MIDMRERGLRPADELAKDRNHGDRLRYISGCRCKDCKRANSEYESERKKARKSGDWNGIVSAQMARDHLMRLSARGGGRRAVQAATDIPDSTLSAIRSGKKLRIRARTQRKIMMVDVDMASDKATVPSKTTWDLLNKLISKGYTKSRIAMLLGCKTPALQINKMRCTVRTASRVQKLYSRLESIQFSDAGIRQSEHLPPGTVRVKPGVLVHRMGD